MQRGPGTSCSTVARRLIGAGAAVLVALAAMATPARADPPMRLDEQITDTAGALAGDRGEVERALADLQRSEGIQLWVAYVPTFDGLSGQQWAEQTAELSGLGGNDMLFAVATQDRAYGQSVPAELPVSDAELDTILAQEVEPELAQGDWAGAAVALADSLADPGGSSAWPWIAGVALLGLLVLGAWLLLRSRRRTGPGDGPAGADGTPQPLPAIEQVRQAAAAALIEADDSIKTSEQELGFAIAQFGDVTAQPFTEALAASRAELDQAFAVQAQAKAGSSQERGQLDEVIALCQSADARLDEQVESFDALRDLERRIDQVLPQLGDQAAGLEKRLASATTVAEQLSAKYPPQALATVTGNLGQAVERVKFAQESVVVGLDLLTESDRTGAVARARAAEESLGQAGTLLDAVERAPQDLAAAEAAVSALIVETEKDIAEAQRLGLGPELASAHRYASETLAWATAAVAAGTYDPLAVRRALEESDTALESALVPQRTAEEARLRAEALLASQTDAARASIQAADDFIRTRRGGIGADARTRLAEAQRQFAAAQAPALDPTSALEGMQAADRLADESLAMAQRDEAHYQNSQQRTGGGGTSITDIMLGGILIDAMSRGGSRGQGGGGGFPTAGGGGFPSSGGGRGPGSFGGGATRGRRSGGGRF